MIGTYQSDALVEPGDNGVSAAEVDAFIVQANEAFPALKLTRGDVTLVHRGVVPAIVRNGRPELKPHPDIIDHASEGAAGAMSVVGVKYTTARGVAERVVNGIGKRLGQRLAPSRTETTVLPGAGIADHEALAIETARELHLELPPRAVTHLIALYAENAAPVVRLIAERPDLAQPIASTETLRAEIVHVIRHDMACRLADIVIRRTALGSAGHPGAAVVSGCAKLAAAELGWDRARTQHELDAVNEFYTLR
jgi:glycerol-3-phosphate dehydrogenase